MFSATFGFILTTALLIAVADSLIKQSATSGDFWGVVLSPWMLGAFALYGIQILLTLYIFLNKGELAIYANLFVAFYSIFTVVIGVFVFKEHLSLVQGIGILVALLGVFLIHSN